jgi:hypothetical protein
MPANHKHATKAAPPLILLKKSAADRKNGDANMIKIPGKAGTIPRRLPVPPSALNTPKTVVIENRKTPAIHIRLAPDFHR